MSEYILLILGAACLGAGAILGYFTRQNIARFQAGSLEQTLQKKLSDAEQESKNIILNAKSRSAEILGSVRKGVDEKRKEVDYSHRQLERKKGILDQKVLDFKEKYQDFQKNQRKTSQLREQLEKVLEKKEKELEQISGISKTQAKKELFEELEKEYKKDIQEKFFKLEKKGEEKFEEKAKEILAFAVQRGVAPFISELTTTSVSLPDDDVKGRIIGKEGRNIKTFEQATGVELVVDETPGIVFLSSFDPLRREIAKVALEKLIKDGRIQPTKIEDTVKNVEESMPERIQKIGEEAAFEAEVFGLNARLYQLLGRLKFRTSFGQNVLGHSLEVAYLSRALAEEIGADPKVAKKAGLLHDIGKAVDAQIEGSHVEIGIRILEKFGIEEEVIKAMKSHHEEYPYESVEGIIVQTADAISSSRTGARRDTAENYLKRLEDLEKIATNFPEVKNAYVIEAGREVRVFVNSEEIDDFGVKKLARNIAKSIEEEIGYSGEIKVNVIRETRIIEYAR